MKKVLLSVIIVSAMMTSCSNNGKKTEAKKAEKVKVVQNNETSTFINVSEGNIKWRASHIGGVQPRYGKIDYKSASVLVNDGKLTNATFLVNMSTLTVESFPKGAEEITKLTGHLQSEDFFNIEKYPTSKFELTNLNSSTGDYNSKVTGNLTILDITKSITFSANINVTENQVSIQSEDFSVDRTDWGLKYNVEGTEGVPIDYIIANDIGFTINVTLTK